MSEIIGEGRCGATTVRPIRWEDADAWSAAMSANYARMSEWWGLREEDRSVRTDKLAFAHHLQEWELRRRRGEGMCMALIGPEGRLVGEAQVWHLASGGLTCELGLWIAPTLSTTTRNCGALVCYVIDRLFDGLDIQRIDAPVAAGNKMPRALLRVGGFEIDASIPKWRELNGQLVDYDLYGLTPERWQAARPKTRATLGEWEPITPPA
ncbi:MAG: GNAT family protein [Mobilicoccus sp.]|nr:GNAT family protein [Mobilicoccus sp.]